MRSPLRYPGGKSDFFAIAKKIFERNGFGGAHVVEPYAGSAAVSLGLLDFGLASKVTLGERDPLMYGFWSCVFERPDELIVRFQDLDISIDSWERLQPFLRVEKPNKSNILDLGLAGLFFNRANFSGILSGGPIGGRGQYSKYKIDCRTNKDDIISRILAISMFSDVVNVQFGDAVDLIGAFKNKSSAFFYLDPPYFNKGELLYRYYYKLGQHKDLASALLDAKFNWLLSYDDNHIIEFLYEDFFVNRLDFQYSVRNPKNHTELLISNFDPQVDVEHDLIMARRQRHWPTASSTLEASTAL
jgi:DNA adenine methylase